MNLFLADATEWTQDQIVQIVDEQLHTDTYYTLADCLRSAAMYCPATLTAKEFVAAAQVHGVNPSTARIQFNQARREMAEMDA